MESIRSSCLYTWRTRQKESLCILLERVTIPNCRITLTWPGKFRNLENPNQRTNKKEKKNIGLDSHYLAWPAKQFAAHIADTKYQKERVRLLRSSACHAMSKREEMDSPHVHHCCGPYRPMVKCMVEMRRNGHSDPHCKRQPCAQSQILLLSAIRTVQVRDKTCGRTSTSQQAVRFMTLLQSSRKSHLTPNGFLSVRTALQPVQSKGDHGKGYRRRSILAEIPM